MKRAVQQTSRSRAQFSMPGSAATPGQIVARANKWRDQYNPLRGLTVARAVSLCEAYNRGEMADLQWTYFAIEQADPDLFTICDRRLGALLEMDWSINIVSGHKRRSGFDPALAAEQQSALREAYDRIDNLYAGIGHIGTAVFRGFAHLEKQCNAAGDIAHLEIGDQWNLVRDGLRGAWKYNPDARAVSFASLPDANLIDPARFIIRETSRHIDHVALKKFIRSSLAEKDWTAFLEIYGIPSGVVIMPANIPSGKESDYETAAGRIAEGGNGALPNGSDYKPNDAPRGVDPFSPFLRYFTEKLVMVGTGGLLTVLSQSGSGTLAGNAHMEAFRTLARGDARQISERFQKSIDTDVLARNFSGKPALAYFELALNQEIAVSEIVEHAQKLSAAGYQMDPAELSEKTRYTLTLKKTGGGGTKTGDGEAKTEAGGPGVGNGGTEKGEGETEMGDGGLKREKSADSHPTGMRSSGASPDAPEELSTPLRNCAASITGRLAGLLNARAEWLAPVAQIFDAIETAARNGELGYEDLLTAVEEAANRMPELFADLDPGALAAAIFDGMNQTAEAAAQSSTSKTQELQ